MWFHWRTENTISNDKKDIPVRNSIFDKSRIINDKLYERTIIQKAKRQNSNITNKIKKLNFLNEEVCDVIFKSINIFG